MQNNAQEIDGRISTQEQQILQSLKQRYEKYKDREQRNLVEAKNIGEDLSKIQELHMDENWKKWVKKNLEIPYSTANTCMNIFKHWDDVDIQGSTSVYQAKRLISIKYGKKDLQGGNLKIPPSEGGNSQQEDPDINLPSRYKFPINQEEINEALETASVLEKAVNQGKQPGSTVLSKAKRFLLKFANISSYILKKLEKENN